MDPGVSLVDSVLHFGANPDFDLYGGLYVHFLGNYEGRQLWGTNMKIVVVTTNYKNLAPG